MEWSAQRVRAKTRAAVKRREDQIESEEIESGELNLIPYLDMVTNLMLFILASISAGLILVQIDTQLPDRAPPSAQPTQPTPQTPPDEQPLKIVLLILPDRVDLGSFSGLEGTLTAPKATFVRTGKEGAQCDGDYMCESNKCDGDRQVCVASQDVPQPVFDYRKINGALIEIATRRYNGKNRKYKTYQAILMADTRIPYSTITSIMAAMRCKLPDFGKEAESCMLPSDDPELKKAQAPISPDEKLFDTERVPYDPNKMALFPDILFSSQISQ
jgi:biopolymer transport protein ExbD